MNVHVRQDRMGNIHLTPASDRVFRRIRRAAGLATIDDSVFFQAGDPAESFLSTLRPAVRRDVEHGWPMTIRMTEDEFLQLAGASSD